MKLHPHRTLLGALAISAALLMSACGASGGSDASDKDEATTTTKATTTTEDPSKEAQARADSVELTVSDFPDGWTAAKPEPDDPDNPLKACDPSFSDKSTQLATNASDDFSIGSLDDNDGTQFSSDTTVFESEAAAKEALDPFNNTEVVNCLDDALRTAFGEGTEGITVEGKLEDDDLSTDEISADQSEGVSASYSISATDGSSATANVGILLIRNGDIATMITILSVGDSLDPTSLKAPITQISDLQKAA